MSILILMCSQNLLSSFYGCIYYSITNYKFCNYNIYKGFDKFLIPLSSSQATKEEKIIAKFKTLGYYNG